jgi:L-alanine-DL-glutamate epimerase-like enolase superfamily enzyme
VHHLAAETARHAGGRAAFDALRGWDPPLTREFARRESGFLVWLEDPLPDAWDRAHAGLGIPLAVGEHLLVDEDPGGLAAGTALRALTVDVLGCGGLTRALRLLDEGHVMVPHGRSLVPALHLAAAFPEAVPCVEYPLRWEPRRQALYATPRTPDHGRIRLGDTPGLGTTPRSKHAR